MIDSTNSMLQYSFKKVVVIDSRVYKNQFFRQANIMALVVAQ